MKYWIALIFLISSFSSFSQDQLKNIQVSPTFHWRTFWMSTSYPEDFRDDYALGTSVAVGFRAKVHQKWTVQASYRGFANVFSSDIWELEPYSKRENRYETGLFNFLEPGQQVFGSLEILNLSYQTKSWKVAVGRMPINTAWINPADGRLAPTLMEGATVSYSPSKSWKFSGWYINRFRVRGTNQFLNIGESIGVYGVGRDETGATSAYQGNTHSNFVSVVQAEFFKEGHHYTFSHTLADNLFSTFWGDWNYKFPKKEGGLSWILGVQAGYQHGIGDGGNPESTFRYKNPNDQNWVISLSGGLEYGKGKTVLGFTQLGGQGRWLSPREWGKDAWFTFVPRERNEGMGQLTALTLLSEYNLGNQWNVYGHFGFHWLPDFADAAANKYAFPSYRQVNLGVKFKPEKMPKADFHLLVMNKEALGSPTLSPAQRYNKVEMIHVNFIVNFRIE
ncbi:MAG: hypothetical protein HWE15_00480 [Algoriphagus sp.]|uniref:hypothetical protein n=1 Tax=Algoriphagus sp. TaxID=1872435 RepID=UPI0018322753|nr:hypothetical protein [Algoriphagus sp.]NVJ84749.1 hypothetical protein [Algoriphagus sp.]